METDNLLSSLELPFEAIRFSILFVLLLWLVQQGRARAVLARNGWNYLIWGFACILGSSAADLAEAIVESTGSDLSSAAEETQAFTRGVLVIIGFSLAAKGLIRFVPTIWKLDAEIEERRRAETSLRDAITQSERLNQEKLAITEQLFQAQKMEALGRMAGGISHDFNNLLNIIRGCGEILTEDLEASDDRRTFAVRIVDASRQAQGVIEQILAFSRPKSGSREIFDASALIRETLQMFSATLPQASSITYTHAAEKAVVCADSAQISQVLMNLCVNARDAIGDGPGQMRVSSEATVIANGEGAGPPRIDMTSPGATRFVISAAKPGTPCVRLTVADTGAGINRKVLEKIFEPFFTTKPVNKGTGLGLSVVHGIVISHYGAIIVETEVDKGTSISVLLPLAENGKISAERPSMAKVHHGNGRAVVLVDDEPEGAAMLAKRLRRLGYCVHICGDGMTALAHVSAMPSDIDVVITDQSMPGMTGTELIRQLRLSGYAGPAVLVTGCIDDLQEELLTIQPAALLMKPIEMLDLAQLLEGCLSGGTPATGLSTLAGVDESPTPRIGQAA